MVERNPRYYSAGDFILGVVNKCAGNSLVTKCREIEGGLHPLRPEEVLKQRTDRPVRLYMREPIDRLESAYCFFREQYRKRQRSHEEHLQFEDFSEFVDAIMTIWDPHWAPVVQHHTYKRVFLPTDVRRFEDIGEFLGPIHNNKSPREPVPWTEDVLGRVYVRWAEDFALYGTLAGGL